MMTHVIQYRPRHVQLAVNSGPQRHTWFGRSMKIRSSGDRESQPLGEGLIEADIARGMIAMIRLDRSQPNLLHLTYVLLDDLGISRNAAGVG